MHDRRRRLRPAIVTLLALAALAWSATAPLTAFGAVGISLAPVANGLVNPTQITNAHDGTDRLFVVEQRGTIRVIQGGVLQPGFFMDIAGKVADGGERGLLGLAFDPSFKTNHRLFVYYTRNGGDIVVSRFTTNAARTECHREHRPSDAAHRAQRPEQPQRRRHGVRPERLPLHRRRRRGGGGDPRNNGQNKGRLLGKILRINVNGSGHRPFGHYSVPRSNPFVGSQARSRGDLGLRRCATRGGSRSIAAPASCSSPTSARTASRRSTARRPASPVGRELWLERHGGPALLHGRPSARSPATPCPTLSTRTTTATARSPAGTSIAGRPRRHSSGCTSSPTTAAVGSGRSRTTARR